MRFVPTADVVALFLSSLRMYLTQMLLSFSFFVDCFPLLNSAG
jgi:hypothetical protein